MPIESVTTDPATLTLTAIGRYPVPVKRLWNAWCDPRQLERFWGPPTWPATFTAHEMRAGARSQYFMTGPQGETSHGYWIIEKVEPEKSFSISDGFAHPDGSPNEEFPQSKMEVSFEATEEGSRFVCVSTFANLESMEKLVEMGMKEGLTLAMGQLDTVLEDLRDLSADYQAHLEVLDDTTVLVSRIIRGSLALVWRAHQEKELMQKWLLGPEGWTMPVCEIAKAAGDSYRYEWENQESGERFGFVGELLEIEAPRRMLSTEQMIGIEGPGTQNELILTPQPGSHTRLSVKITYPSKEVRDMVLGTGMLDGMEASYARLESLSKLK